MNKTLAFLALALSGATQAQTLEHIKQTGAITIAYRESSVPFSYVVQGLPEPVGLSIDLCKKVAQAVKAELKLPALKTNWVAVSSATRIPTIQEGKADIECGSTTDNRERREQVAFSHHHFFAAVQMLTKTGGPVKEWSDLEGKTAVFTQGTSTKASVEKNPRTKSLKFKVVEGKDHKDSFSLLASGQADVFVLEDVLLAGLRAASAKPKDFELVGSRLTIEPYALMVRKGDATFLRVVNRELERLYQSGDYAKLYDKWFMKPIQPNDLVLSLPPSSLLRSQMRRPQSIIPD